MTSAPPQSRRRVGSLEVLLVGLIALALSAGLVSGFVAGNSGLRTAATVFCGVFVQALPFLVLGVVVSGLIAAFVSAERLERWLPRRPALAVAVAGVGGAALPGCECGSVPVARRLFGPGTNGAAALTFMLSAPAINPVVLVATAVAFPGQPAMVLARCVASLATAVVMGLLWSRFGKNEWVTRDLPEAAPDGSSRWAVFTEAARHDFLQAASYLVLGAAAAAALHVLVPAWVFEHLAGNLVVGVVTMALLAAVLALCSEADAFVVASLTMVPLVPRLVFLVVGPAFDVKLAAMQRACSAAPSRCASVRPLWWWPASSRRLSGWRSLAVAREPGDPESGAAVGRPEHRGDVGEGHLPELREARTAAVARDCGGGAGDARPGVDRARPAIGSTRAR